MSAEQTQTIALGTPTEALVGHVDYCQNCGHKPLAPVIDFGHHPPCDSLLRTEQLNKPEAFYPLALFRCTECQMVQIDYAVDPEELFYDGYPYTTGITSALKSNFDALAAKMIDTLGLEQGSLVVDIGSNDGTILSGFQSRGMNVRGIEPTGIAKIANANGIPTTQAFFNEAVAEETRASFGAAKLITAANVFAHVAELGSCIKGIYNLLDDEGTFVSESHYLLPLIETLQYDTIYHEHLRFYALRPLIDMLERYGFSVVDAERIPNHGGSIRVYAKKAFTSAEPSERLKELLQAEEDFGLYEDETYVKFAQRVQASKWKLMELLGRLKAEGATIAGLGSPGRSSTIMNYCGITPDVVNYIGEQPTSLKVGLYTPGTHVPVVEEQRLLDEQPDYALVLAWHLGDTIPRKLREKGLKSKFIMPLPEPTILDW